MLRSTVYPLSWKCISFKLTFSWSEITGTDFLMHCLCGQSSCYVQFTSSECCCCLSIRLTNWLTVFHLQAYQEDIHNSITYQLLVAFQYFYDILSAVFAIAWCSVQELFGFLWNFWIFSKFFPDREKSFWKNHCGESRSLCTIWPNLTKVLKAFLSVLFIQNWIESRKLTKFPNNLFNMFLLFSPVQFENGKFFVQSCLSPHVRDALDHFHENVASRL